jgi:RNA polymerase sigma-70 factor, ECF subfamily
MTDPSPEEVPPSEVTELFARIQDGELGAVEALLPLLYRELRAMAGSYFQRQTPGHTLQPTALVHEVFLKLARGQGADWESRAHFLAVAARAMRQVLANHAESKRAAKRGGGMPRITLSGLATPPHAESLVDLIDLDDALAKLSEVSTRQARIVEMRFLAGIGEEEIAHVLGVSTRTVQREWRMARAFLKCELSGDELS